MLATELTNASADSRIRPRYDLLAAWLIVHGVLIVSLLTYHTSTIPSIAGQYSPLFLIALIVLALWAIGSSVLIIMLARRSDQRFASLLGGFGRLRTRSVFRAAVLLIATFGITLYWLRFPDVLADVPHPYLRFVLTIAIFAVLYVGLFWRAPDPLIRWRWWIALGVLAISAALFVSIEFNGQYPQMDTLDEIHNYIVQWTYAHTGLLGDWTWREMVPLPQPWYDTSHRLIGLLMRVIGDGFWQARFSRLLLACLSLPFIYNSGKILYGKRTAMLAVVAGVFYLIATNYARPDFFVGLLVSIGLYVYLKAAQADQPLLSRLRQAGSGLSFRLRSTLRSAFLLHVLTGLFFGLAVEGHLLAYRFGLGIGLIYGLTWIGRMWRQKRIFIDGQLIALGVGVGIALAIYVSLHILPNPPQALSFLHGYSPTTLRTATQWDTAISIVRRQIEVWLQTSPIEFWVFLPALILAIIRFGRGDRIILTLLIVSEVLLVASYGYYRSFYQVHYLPLVALLIGKALADGFDRKPGVRPERARLSQLVFTALILCTTVVVLIDDANTTTDPMRTEFESIGTQLAATLPPGLTVMANEDYFVQLVEHTNFYTVSTVSSPGWFIPTVQGYALFQQVQPDVIVLSTPIDNPKYVPYDVIYSYMQDNNFVQARCYTATGLIDAQVWVRQAIPGWTINEACLNYAAGS